ncbi:unnamed protein product [Calypogeia fissa]
MQVPKGGHKIITKTAVLGALPLLSPTPEPNTIADDIPNKKPTGVFCNYRERLHRRGRYSLRSSFLPVVFQGVHFPSEPSCNDLAVSLFYDSDAVPSSLILHM